MGEKHMKIAPIRKAQLLAIVLLLFLFIHYSNATPVANKIFSLVLNYNNGSLAAVDISVTDGFAPDRKIQPESGWKAEIISFNDSTLESFKFQIPNMLSLSPPLEGQGLPPGLITLSNINFTLIMQYYSDAKHLNFYNESNAKILSLDVSKFATCNLNGICESGESYEICSADCRPFGTLIWLIVTICAVMALAAISVKLQKKSIKLQRS